MQFKSILTCASILIVTAASQGRSLTWVGGASGATQDWTVAANWSPAFAPVNGDSVTVPNVTHDPILATDISLVTLTINSGGQLSIDASSGVADLVVTGTDGAPFAGTVNIASDGTLTLQGSSSLALTGTVNVDGGVFTISGNGTQDVDGPIEVAAAGVFNITGGATLDITSYIELATTADLNIQNSSASFTGAGSVFGLDELAFINIDNGLTLTSQVDIEGAMTMNGPGTFRNDGTVAANMAGVFELASNLTLANASSGTWEADTNSSAELWFSRAHTASPVGGSVFVDDCATIVFYDVAVKFTGTYTDNGGKLDDGPLDTGTFQHSCPSSCTPVSLPDTSC